MNQDVKIIESDALKANLQETSFRVEIPKEYDVLLEVVARFRGLESSLARLLHEICHPYRNWKMVLPHLRGFVLKNMHHYLADENGPECLRLFAGFFVEAMEDCKETGHLLGQVVAAQMVWLEKEGRSKQRFWPKRGNLPEAVQGTARRALPWN